MNRFEKYLHKHGFDRTLDELGIDYSTFWKWKNGKSAPTRNRAIRIARATDGKVKVSDVILFGIKEEDL